jgi:hypothetical protein
MVVALIAAANTRASSSAPPGTRLGPGHDQVAGFGGGGGFRTAVAGVVGAGGLAGADGVPNTGGMVCPGGMACAGGVGWVVGVACAGVGGVGGGVGVG